MAVNLFDVNFYRAANPDLAAATTDAQIWSHFQSFGLSEGRAFSPFVNLNFYRASNPDLATVGLNTNAELYEHLQNYGVGEGRRFSDFTDTNFYLAANPDVAQAFGGNRELAFQHLKNEGLAEGRRFCQSVDLNFYRTNNSDLAVFNNSQALQHLEIYGLKEGRQFSVPFDVNYYRSVNSDLQAAGLSNQQLYDHFQFYGLAEGRASSSSFNVSYYLAHNSDLKAANYHNYQAYDHFVIFGFKEGRIASEPAGGGLYNKTVHSTIKVATRYNLSASVTVEIPVVPVVTTPPAIAQPPVAPVVTTPPAIAQPSVAPVVTTTPAITEPPVAPVVTTPPVITLAIAPEVTTPPAITEPPVAPEMTTTPVITLPIAPEVTTTPAIAQPPIAPVVTDWFSQNFVDAELQTLIRNQTADGVLTRNELIAIFQDSEDGGVVDATELTDLHTLVSNASYLGMLDSVRVLSNKIVNGDTANKMYQGANLGNLNAGSSAAQMENLINKWFLGSDRPTTSYTYQYASGSLFQNDISYQDIEGGNLSDCYFLSGLAQTAFRSSNTIQSMFTDNGDDTYTVRFYNNGVADYVTVDRYLPTTSQGTFTYANMDDLLSSSANELWVALAEKAYAQLNESGWIGQDNTNSYQGIADGWDGNAVKHISGRRTTYASLNLNNMANAFDTGSLMGVSSKSSGVASNIVSSHAYTVVDYNSSTQKFTLFNPWGMDGDYQGGNFKPGILDLSWSELTASFDGWTRTVA